MIDWIWLLFPGWSTAAEQLTWAVIVAVTVVTVGTLLRLSWLRRAFRARVAHVSALIDEASAGASRSQLRNSAASRDPEVAAIWTEFDETLVEIGPDQVVHNTVNADAYFNEHTLATGLTENRLLAAVPGILTALGVLGTFLGLVIGLGGLHSADALSGSAEVDALSKGIEDLIGAAGTAFVTSVWGVVGSIIVNVVEKEGERRARATIQDLQYRIDATFAKLTPERTLVNIEQAAIESQYALQALDERIGDRLQTSIDGMAVSVQEAIARAIGPAMSQVVARTSAQSTEVFDSLVAKFAESFSALGEKQAQAMVDAASKLGTRLDQLDRTLEEAGSIHRSVAASLTDIRDSLRLASEQILRSSASLETTGSSLTKAMADASETLTQMSSRINVALIALDEGVESLERDRAAMTAVSQALGAASTELATSNEKFAEQIGEFTQVQRDFHDGLTASADGVSEALRAQVQTLEKEVGSWLTRYAESVDRQVVDRMGLWNTHSQEYANQMLNVAGALQEVLQQMESRASTALEAEASA